MEYLEYGMNDYDNIIADNIIADMLQEDEILMNSIIEYSLFVDNNNNDNNNDNNDNNNIEDITITCPICLNEVYNEDKYDMEHDNHITCRDCAREYIKHHLNEHKFNIKCIYNNCNSILTENKCFEVLNENEQQFYLQLTRCPQTDPEFRQCPAPDCQGYCLLEPNSSECICYLCHFHWCSNCEVNLDTTEHKTMNCEEYQEWRRLNHHNDDEGRQILYQGIRDKNGANRIRLCPNCKHPYSKDDRCNHVVCTAGCGVHFCFHCANFFSNDGRDVYNHFGTCPLFFVNRNDENEDENDEEDEDDEEEED